LLSTLCGKQLEAGLAAPSSTTLSDQQSQEAKSTLYKTLQYKTILATKGSFIDKSDLGITDKTKDDFQILLSAEQLVLKDSLFRDDLFKTTY
jgi:hypothetical protein